MKKKIIVSLVSIIMAIMILIGSVNAANDVNYAMSLNSNINEKTVTVKLAITNAGDGMDAISGTLNYDKDKLEFVEMKRATNQWKDPDYVTTTGKFTMLINGESAKNASEILIVTFKLKDNVTGKANISVTGLTLADHNDQKIAISDLSTSVTQSNNSEEGNKTENTENNIVSENNTTGGTNNTTNNTTTTNKINKTNSSKNTQATMNIPKAGVQQYMIYLLCAVVIVAVGCFIKYKKIDK